MKLSDFDYNLPERFVAQTPCNPRDHSKLLVYNRATDVTEIKYFYDIIDYLKKGDVVVINTTRVMPARLMGIKEKPPVLTHHPLYKGGIPDTKIEVLLLRNLEAENSPFIKGGGTIGDGGFLSEDTHVTGCFYEVICKPLKRLKPHDKIIFDGGVIGELIDKDINTGTATMQFNISPEKIGEMPLPHYIHDYTGDKERYQTVYSKTVGSAAAPTAGLHWTPELMQKARGKGVIFAEVLLHVGLGTFRPVKVNEIEEHKMHSEYYEVTPETAKIISNAKVQGRRVICTGTTSVRTLEAIYKKHGKIIADTGETDIFIYPGKKFGVVDAMITNFHLPKSTLLMLVSAFVGREKILELYEIAKQNDFRFFSFGDACLFI